MKNQVTIKHIHLNSTCANFFCDFKLDVSKTDITSRSVNGF